MDIANKWSVTKTLFKNNKTLYAKSILLGHRNKENTLAIVPTLIFRFPSKKKFSKPSKSSSKKLYKPTRLHWGGKF